MERAGGSPTPRTAPWWADGRRGTRLQAPRRAVAAISRCAQLRAFLADRRRTSPIACLRPGVCVEYMKTALLREDAGLRRTLPTLPRLH